MASSEIDRASTFHRRAVSEKYRLLESRRDSPYVIPMSARLISVPTWREIQNIPIFVVTPTVPTNSSMNLITIKNRYLRVQHRVGPSDSESTDFSRARVLSGRTRSNLIHRFGETHGQQTVARSCDTIRNQRESHRICPVFLAGPNFCTRPFPSFRWVKKPRSLAERKAGVIHPTMWRYAGHFSW